MTSQVSSFQLLRLKHLHCDDLHIILNLTYIIILAVFCGPQCRLLLLVYFNVAVGLLSKR